MISGTDSMRTSWWQKTLKYLYVSRRRVNINYDLSSDCNNWLDLISIRYLKYILSHSNKSNMKELSHTNTAYNSVRWVKIQTGHLLGLTVLFNSCATKNISAVFSFNDCWKETLPVIASGCSNQNNSVGNSNSRCWDTVESRKMPWTSCVLY